MGRCRRGGEKYYLLEMFGTWSKNVNQYYRIYKISNFDDIKEISKSNSSKITFVL